MIFPLVPCGFRNDSEDYGTSLWDALWFGDHGLKISGFGALSLVCGSKWVFKQCPR